MKRNGLVALSEWLTALALMAWLGGMVALGAFTARIVFRKLPLDLAAPTMNAIFRSFDGVIIAALVVLAVATLLRLWTRGLATRADRIALAASLALLVLGVSDVAFIHPRIDEMFRTGRTLEPAFAALHRLSSRAVNLELLIAALLLGAHAWSRREA